MGLRTSIRRQLTASVAALAVAMASVVTTAPGAIRAAEPVPSFPPRAVDPSAERTTVSDEILIRYRPGTTPSERRAIARTYDLTRVRGSRGGRTEVVVAGGRSTATVKRQLMDDPNIEAVAPNHRRELADDISGEPEFDELWALHNVGQRIDGNTVQTGVSDIDIDALQALRLGIGDPSVVVAVVDDGIDIGHRDLASRIWTNPGEAGTLAANGVDDDGNGFVDDVHGWDFCNNDNTVHDLYQDGHGTHVAGTIAASLDGGGIVGVAPGVTVMPLKFIDDGPFCGSDDMAVDAIDYAASFGVRIINASWGGPQPSTVLDAAIADSGALLVAAAGNYGWNLDAAPTQGSPNRFYPASSKLLNIVSVAAVDQAGRRPGFSNYGATTVDIGAPGTNILSTYPAVGTCPGDCYAWSAGTSMAAPHVTGVAALVGSHFPSLLADPLKLRSRLLRTGLSLSSLAGRTASGRMVNAYRAVDAVAPVVAAPTGFAVPTGTVVGSSTTAARISWPAATDAMTSVSSYALGRRSTGSWSTVTSKTTKTSATTTVRFGTGYAFRLTARDAPGNTSAPADSPFVTATLHPDSSGLATYGRGWSTVKSSSALGGKLHTARTAGAAMTFKFTGRSVAIVAPRSSSRGQFKVYLDGTLVATVDLYRASAQARAAVFSKGWTTRSTHTLRIVAVSGKRVDIDGFVVMR